MISVRIRQSKHIGRHDSLSTRTFDHTRSIANVQRSGVCHKVKIINQTTPDRCINPLSPHDAIKHNFTSMKTYLFFLQQRVLERKFPWTGSPIGLRGNFL